MANIVRKLKLLASCGVFPRTMLTAAREIERRGASVTFRSVPVISDGVGGGGGVLGSSGGSFGPWPQPRGKGETMVKPEPGKFYKTRGGEKAHVLGRREDGEEYLFVGYIVGGVSAVWNKDGRLGAFVKECQLDLIEEWVEPVERTFWVNVYAGGTAVHPTRERADCTQRRNRLACVKVTCTEGQFDE